MPDTNPRVLSFMKKFSMISLFLLLLAVVSVSCADPTLNDYVNEFKNRLPEDMGSGLVMTDVSIVDDFVQIECTSDESELKLDNPLIKSILPSVAEPIKASFLDTADMKDFMQACSDEGKGFRMIMKGAQSGESMVMFEVTPDEVKAKFPPRTKE